MSHTVPAAQVDNLTKVYQGRAVVDTVSFDLLPGRSYFLVGPNGCGKTTTLETLVGLRSPTSGTVRLLGHDPRRTNELRHRIRVCLQGAALHSQVTVREHLTFIAALFEVPTSAVGDVAEQFGIAELLGRRYGRLSGGQQRRVLVASSMFGKSDFIFLDEPTSGVDIESRLTLWGSLRSALAQQPATVLATTHDLNEAEDYADEVIVMRAGRVVAKDTPAGIIAATGLTGVLTVPTVPARELTEARQGVDRRTLSQDGGSTILAYPDRAVMAEDARWLAARDVHVAERSPRLSDAYLFTFHGSEDAG